MSKDLKEHCLGDAEVAAAVSGASRQDLEKVAGLLVAKERVPLGGVTKKLVERAVSTVAGTVLPLPDEALGVISSSLE